MKVCRHRIGGLPWRAISELGVALVCAGLVACSQVDPARTPSAEVAPLAKPSTPQPTLPRFDKLPPAAKVGSWEAFKLQAAGRLVQAHPDSTYLGIPPEPLYGIPVLEVELHGDGRVRRITVLREPSEAKETIAMAIAAVHRAAPYGDVSHLPKPWRFVEVFLFDEQLRFKPATLDR